MIRLGRVDLRALVALLCAAALVVCGLPLEIHPRACDGDCGDECCCAAEAAASSCCSAEHRGRPGPELVSACGCSSQRGSLCVPAGPPRAFAERCAIDLFEPAERGLCPLRVASTPASRRPEPEVPPPRARAVQHFAPGTLRRA